MSERKGKYCPIRARERKKFTPKQQLIIVSIYENFSKQEHTAEMS